MLKRVTLLAAAAVVAHAWLPSAPRSLRRLPTQSLRRLPTHHKAALNDDFLINVPEEDDRSTEFEQFLAELVFSQGDVRQDIARNMDRCDADFLKFVGDKADASDDLEERDALRSLVDIVKKVEDALAAQAGPASKYAQDTIVDVNAVSYDDASSGGVLDAKTEQEVLAEMREFQGIDDAEAKARLAEEAAFAAAQASEGAKQTYRDLIKRVVDERPEGQTLAIAVQMVYDQCDYAMMTILKAEADAPTTTPERAAQLRAMSEAVNTVAAERLGAAQGKLVQILQSGSPADMENTLAAMATRGEVDEPLLLMIEGNLVQARAAGEAGAGAVQVMERLLAVGKEAADAAKDPPVRLLRQLLRTETNKARGEIFDEAFRPRESISLSEEERTSDEPLVKPPDFISVVQVAMTQFGNVATGDGTLFEVKLKELIDEAEAAAVRNYGQAKNPQERQDQAWNERSVSVFDLEAMENDLMAKGEEAVWANDKYDAMQPDDFIKGEDGQKPKDRRIGG